jgi:hypothetical protein
MADGSLPVATPPDGVSGGASASVGAGGERSALVTKGGGASASPWRIDEFTNADLSSAPYTGRSGATRLDADGGHIRLVGTGVSRFLRKDFALVDGMAVLRVWWDGTGDAQVGVLLKGLGSTGATDHLMARVGTGGSCELYVARGGVYSLKASSTVVDPPVGTDWWFGGEVIGDTFRLYRWDTGDPRAGDPPTHTLEWTLTGQDATDFGAGVGGIVGVRTTTQVNVPTLLLLDDLSAGTYGGAGAGTRTVLVTKGGGGTASSQSGGVRRALPTKMGGGAASGAAGGTRKVTVTKASGARATSAGGGVRTEPVNWPGGGTATGVGGGTKKVQVAKAGGARATGVAGGIKKSPVSRAGGALATGIGGGAKKLLVTKVGGAMATGAAGGVRRVLRAVVLDRPTGVVLDRVVRGVGLDPRATAVLLDVRVRSVVLDDRGAVLDDAPRTILA